MFTYKPKSLKKFIIRDPKTRTIHSSAFRDRVVYHALVNILEPIFDPTFIHDSYSCRIGKGVHKSIKRFETFARKEGLNNTRTVWVLKGDIRKCFASVDHSILRLLLGKEVRCPKMLKILDSVNAENISKYFD